MDSDSGIPSPRDIEVGLRFASVIQLSQALAERSSVLVIYTYGVPGESIPFIGFKTPRPEVLEDVADWLSDNAGTLFR